jgi:hypothetical protein
MSLSLEIVSVGGDDQEPEGHQCFGLLNHNKALGAAWCYEEAVYPTALMAFAIGLLEGVSVLGQDTGTTSGTFVKMAGWRFGRDDVGLYVVDQRDGTVTRFNNWSGVLAYVFASPLRTPLR